MLIINAHVIKYWNAFTLHSFFSMCLCVMHIRISQHSSHINCVGITCVKSYFSVSIQYGMWRDRVMKSYMLEILLFIEVLWMFIFLGSYYLFFRFQEGILCPKPSLLVQEITLILVIVIVIFLAQRWGEVKSHINMFSFN